ncbi:phage portal protein [Brevibacillus laterosporus]
MSREMQEIERILRQGAMSTATTEQIIQIEINEWKTSEKRQWMLAGEQYYRNKTDVLKRERTAIGTNGCKEIVGNLANNKLVNGFIRKLVDQKVGYLLSKPLSILSDNENYQKELSQRFDKSMLRMLQNIGKESINKGIAWLHVFYDEIGQLSFKKIPSEEIIPLWRDAGHTELDALIRTYKIEVYEGLERKNVTKIEWWDTNGVRRYVMQDGLIPDVEAGDDSSHFLATGPNGEEQHFNWNRVPFIAFKYNEEEQPLVELIKSLIDDYDNRKSDNTNNLEDLPNSIYVVKGFGDRKLEKSEKIFLPIALSRLMTLMVTLV